LTPGPVYLCGVPTGTRNGTGTQTRTTAAWCTNKRRPAYVLVDEALTRYVIGPTYFAAGIPSVARALVYMDAVGHQLSDVKH